LLVEALAAFEALGSEAFVRETEARQVECFVHAVDADYEVALTLEALGRTGLGNPEAESESRAILERLGVLSTPLVPLP
jgi:hypothetical protein